MSDDRAELARAWDERQKAAAEKNARSHDAANRWLRAEIGRALERDGKPVPEHLSGAAQVDSGRRRGRPTGPTVARERIVETFRALAERGRPTQDDLAASLGIATRTLQDTLRAYGLTWPIE